MFTVIALLSAFEMGVCSGNDEFIFVDQDLLLGSSNSLSVAALLVGRRSLMTGVGIVAGDSNIHDALETAEDIVWATRSNVSFYRGAGRPWVLTGQEVLLQEPLTGGKVGDGWLGEWNPGRTAEDVRMGVRRDHGVSEPSGRVITRISAAEAIVAAARAHPGALHVIMLGPLTNLATALVIEPDLPKLVSRLTVMAGALHVKSKFNFWWDPHAAARVLRTAGWRHKTLVPIDVCQQTTTSAEIVQRIAEAAGTQSLRAKQWILEQYNAGRLARHHAELNLPMWDELTAVIALEPPLTSTTPAKGSVVLEAMEAWVDVELSPGQARGSTHWWDVKLVGKAKPPHWAESCGPWKIVTTVNVTEFNNRFVSLFRGEETQDRSSNEL